MKKFNPEKKSITKRISCFFSLENRAQSGAVFRLMIDGIIGLAILLIIISALTYFQSLRFQASNEKFFSLVESATNSPNGKVFEEKNLLFSEGGISAISIRNKTNIFEECFEFQSNLSSAKVNSKQTMITFTSVIEANVYAQCVPNPDEKNGCDIDDQECCGFICAISFGKRLTASEGS